VRALCTIPTSFVTSEKRFGRAGFAAAGLANSERNVVFCHEWRRDGVQSLPRLRAKMYAPSALVLHFGGIRFTLDDLLDCEARGL
jgi:hypothetical protein